MKGASKCGLSKQQKKTLIRVMEGLFEKYRLYKYLTSDNICKAEERAEWERFCKEMEYVVSSLFPEEQKIIQERYMVDDYTSDVEVYEKECISHITYSKRKLSGFYNISLMLQREK